VALTDLIETRKTALTVLEVAEILSVSKRLVYQLVSIGEMPHFKVGGAVRFEPQALALWLRERMVESAKEKPPDGYRGEDARQDGGAVRYSAVAA
jgi:excisionase family DNA binding protein